MAIAIENSGADVFVNVESPSLSITTPSANNLLVCIISAEDNTLPNPAGWTLMEFSLGGSIRGHYYYKIAVGTETTIDYTATSATADTSIAYVEISGCDSSSPLEDSSEDITYINTNTTSCSSGSATATESDGIAVAGFSFSRSDLWTGRTYTNSFSEEVFSGEDAYDPGSILATLIYSSSGSKTTTLSTSDIGQKCYGAIAVFKSAGGPSGLSIPLSVHNSQQKWRA